MVSPHSLPNLKQRYFDYKELSKLHGKPNLQSIIDVFRQLKRNAQRILARLTGGNHEYFAILLSTIDYDTLGIIPFMRPIECQYKRDKSPVNHINQ